MLGGDGGGGHKHVIVTMVIYIPIPFLVLPSSRKGALVVHR